MQQDSNRKQQRLNSVEIKKVQKIFYAEHKPAHDQKWNDFARTYPEIARNFLVQADLIRDSHLDRGDIYLHAAAELFTVLNRKQTIKELEHFTIKSRAASEAHKHSIKDLSKCEVCSNLSD